MRRKGSLRNDSLNFILFRVVKIMHSPVLETPVKHNTLMKSVDLASEQRSSTLSG